MSFQIRHRQDDRTFFDEKNTYYDVRIRSQQHNNTTTTTTTTTAATTT